MADYMMDYSDENLEEGKELIAVDDGEYTVRIKDWKSDDDGRIKMEDKNGNPFMMPILEIINCEEADYSRDIMHYLPSPTADMTPKERNNAKFNLRTFFEAFGIDYHQAIDPEETLGMEADALLTVMPDTGYGESNKVKRWIISH